MLLLLVFSGTLNLSGSNICVLGFSAIYVLCWIARSVILISWLISSDPLPLPKFFIALEQSSIAAITLSECVMVVRVRFLCIKCIVSMKRLLLVDFMWHLCVR